MDKRPRKPKGRLRRRYDEWRHTLSDNQFARVRFMVAGGGAALVLLAAGIALRPVWNGWRHRRAMEQAMDYAERQDYRNTLLALKRATELAPLDLATWRAVSDRLAELGSPETVMARENAVRLSPADMAMRLALVSDALRFGQVDLAESTLGEIDEAARRDAGFHRLAAAVAVATGETGRLEEHLEALVKAEPGDDNARFNLCAVRLWGADVAKQAEALRGLEELTASPVARVRASLELLKHAARVRDPARARAVTDLLVSRLGVRAAATSLDGTEPPGWSALLQGLKDAAVRGGAADTALVARWLGDVRLGREALVWIDGLPDGVRTDAAVARVAASLSAESGDFDRLGPLLLAGALGPLPPDAARLAIAARVQMVRYQKSRGRGTWEDALTACGESPQAFAALASLADIWGDTEGNERALREVLRRQPRAHWAYLALRNLYSAQGDTAGLWQLYGDWMRVRPDRADFIRTWLSLGLVLNRLPAPARQTALQRAEAADADPLDRALAAAVHWRDREQDRAVALLDTLSPADCNRPDVAFWRAVVLAATPARADDARQALNAARRPGLFGEQVLLLDEAEKVTGKVMK